MTPSHSGTGPATGFHLADHDALHGLQWWIRDTPLIDPRSGEPIDVSVLCEGDDQWDDIDQSTLGTLDETAAGLIDACLSFVHQEISGAPEVFGLTKDQAAVLVKQPASALAIHEPDVVFTGDGTWFVRFSQGPWPICDPYGIAVVFVGHTPVRLLDLSDAVEIE